jgi:hypothetical protein
VSSPKPHGLSFVARAKALRRRVISWWADSKPASPVTFLPWPTLFAAGRSVPQVQEAYFPAQPRLLSTGKRLNDEHLASIFKKEILGDWSLNADTLNFFEKRIKSARPQVILEFGSGISTVCWAHWMQEIHGSQPAQVRVLSVDQNDWQVEETREQLRLLGLDSLVRLFHAPLAQQTFGEIEAKSYRLSEPEFSGWLGAAVLDWVIIDGPFGGQDSRWCRFPVLPLIQPHLKADAVFYLDDAFRINELSVAQEWSKLPFVHIDGIYRVGKGVLMGRIQADRL